MVPVTSVGSVVGQPFNEAYCAAKFTVEDFMEWLAPVAATVGVSVGVVEQAGPYAPALTAYLARTRDAFATAQTPADAAASIVELLEAGRPAFRVQTSNAARVHRDEARGSGRLGCAGPDQRMDRPAPFDT